MVGGNSGWTPKDIDAALWYKDAYGYYNMYVKDKQGNAVHAWLAMRPHYCDRGHIMFCLEGVDIDHADSFPRYFFSFEEADAHVRTFLKWRLFKHRTHAHKIDDSLNNIAVI